MRLSLDVPVCFSKADYEYGVRSDGGTHGVVLTKPHVVDMILDLVGYRTDVDLTSQRLLEPACGHGAFLVPAIERLLIVAKARGVEPGLLMDAILAFDIDQQHVDLTRNVVKGVLLSHDVSVDTAQRLAEHWIRQDDFLLVPIPAGFHYVVGNPPYIRIEQLGPALQSEYRRRYLTLFDRADLYIAFIERSLRLLAPAGVLSFICADRWTLNKYGAPLRHLVTAEFAVRTYVDLHQASPFESDVIAYPSIFVIARETMSSPVRVVILRDASPLECASVHALPRERTVALDGVTIFDYPTWFTGDDPWVLSSPEQLLALRRLEETFPRLEDGGRTFVRIGIATGCDKVYVVPADADIEPGRLIPLVMRDDCSRGKINDAQRAVLNTYEDKGTVDLSDYPRLKRYFESNEEVLRKRHIAKKNSVGWFRTIDRPHPHMISMPKLLIPDIAGANEVVYDSGRFYPHHNLYFVISDEWDLEVLGGLLSSRVALFFVWSYAVKMRGGYLRFQAQYLRRIRVPQPGAISVDLKRKIKMAFRKRDFVTLDELACEAYELAELPSFDFVDTRAR